MQKYFSEFFGTFFLLLIVTGSGIMAKNLSAGNDAIALLGNSLATGAGLYVLISVLSPISSHFNPAVTLVEGYIGNISKKQMAMFFLMQFVGAIVGVLFSHILFDLPLIQASEHTRSSTGLWISEFISTFSLLFVIRSASIHDKTKIPLFVALIVLSGYWFTSSTFFANPAVTLARAFTDTFVGIALADVIPFMLSQIFAAIFFYYLLKVKIIR